MIDTGTAAELLGVSANTIRKYRECGLIFTRYPPATYRYRRADVERFRDEHTIRPTD
jgi:DNA-binding transcriptional MerR regulator